MNESSPPVLRVEDLHKSYLRGSNRVEALRGTEFSVPHGEFASIMGASGSGKSTLLNILTGLDRADSGDVWLEGKSLSSMSDDELTDLRRCRVGIVFQFFNLLPSLTAAENVALPLRAAGVSRRKSNQRALEMLDQASLSARADHRPGELSGGQMQRVAIARALAIEPRIIVADEPTGNLDSETGEEILDLLRAIHRERGATILMVTHSPAAAAVGDRIISIVDGRVGDEVLTRPGTSRERSLRAVTAVGDTTAAAENPSVRASRAPGSTPVG